MLERRREEGRRKKEEERDYDSFEGWGLFTFVLFVGLYYRLYCMFAL